MKVRHIHIPRIDLELSGVDADTARRALDRLPAALGRALSPGAAEPAAGARSPADALAERVADRIAARVRAGGGA
jgi:hypothetical protein